MRTVLSDVEFCELIQIYDLRKMTTSKKYIFEDLLKDIAGDFSLLFFDFLPEQFCNLSVIYSDSC